MYVADYRNYELKVFGRGNKWEYSIGQGKWNLVSQVKVEGPRQFAQRAAGQHLVSFLSKTEQKRYKLDDLRWCDWVQDTAAWVAETRDWLAGQRSKKS